jgi:hypothetical protein
MNETRSHTGITQEPLKHMATPSRGVLKENQSFFLFAIISPLHST